MNDSKEIPKKCRCCMTDDEKKEDTRQKRNEISRRYYERNKDKLSERHKRYYQQNREKIRQKIDLYQEENKEDILEKKREYYQQNKNSLLTCQAANGSVKVKCEFCNIEISKRSYNRHLATIHPTQFLEKVKLKK